MESTPTPIYGVTSSLARNFSDKNDVTALTLHAEILGCVSFDPFSFHQDCLSPSEVDVGRGGIFRLCRSPQRPVCCAVSHLRLPQLRDNLFCLASLLGHSQSSTRLKAILQGDHF